MRVTEITLRHIKMPLRRPFHTAGWTVTDRECVIVEARTDGLTGWGECVAYRVPDYCSECTGTNWYVLDDFLIPAVLGVDLPDIDAYCSAVAYIRGHYMAKAGLEMALWDLHAQRGGVSLQTMLGGVGDRVQTGISIGIEASPERLLDVVNGFIAEGYTRVKLKIKPGRDVSDVSIVRKHYPNLLLQVDGNSIYRLEQAAQLKRLDDYALLLIEQPLAHDDIVDHASLQPQLTTPICLDESIHSQDDTRKALDLGACRIINIKPGRVGGMSEAKRIHDFCHERKVPVWMGGMLETGLGRAANAALASLPGFTLPGDLAPASRNYADDIVETPMTLNADGTISVPNGVGIGVEINKKVLEKVTLDRKTYST